MSAFAADPSLYQDKKIEEIFVEESTTEKRPLELYVPPPQNHLTKEAFASLVHTATLSSLEAVTDLTAPQDAEESNGLRLQTTAGDIPQLEVDEENLAKELAENLSPLIDPLNWTSTVRVEPRSIRKQEELEDKVVGSLAQIFATSTPEKDQVHYKSWANSIWEHAKSSSSREPGIVMKNIAEERCRKAQAVAAARAAVAAELSLSKSVIDVEDVPLRGDSEPLGLQHIGKVVDRVEPTAALALQRRKSKL